MSQADLAWAVRRLNPLLRPDASSISKLERSTVPGANFFYAIAQATAHDLAFFFVDVDHEPRERVVIARRAAAHRKLDEALRTLAVGIATIAVAVGLSLASPARAGSGPAAALRAEISAYEKRDWSRLWASYTPRFHRTCPHAAWLASAREARATFPARLRIGLVFTSIRVRGTRAVLSYRMIYQGRLLATARGDVFLLIRGRWLDDLDGVTKCS